MSKVEFLWESLRACVSVCTCVHALLLYDKYRGQETRSQSQLTIVSVIRFYVSL